jgi:hypothetical protein
MSEQPKSWFILPYNHFEPDKLIKLGQITATPNEPHEVIHSGGPLDFPDDMPLSFSSAEDFHWDKKSASDGHASISAETTALPLSGKIGTAFKKTIHNWADFKKLETKMISPTPQYIKDSMNRYTVKEFLGNYLLPKSVFMITGVKIARSAETGQERTSAMGGILKVGVTATPSVPVSLGPNFGGSSNSSSEIKAKADDFVWAVSLRQIHYRRGKVGKNNTYYDGATLQDRDNESELNDEIQGSEAPSTGDQPNQELEVEGLDADTFTGEGSRLVKITERYVDDAGDVFLVTEKK